MKSRNREILAHLALATSRYERELRSEGVAPPPEVVWLREFLADCATVRQDATALGATAEAVHAEVMSDQPVLTKREVASFLRVSVRSVERLIESGALTAVSIVGGTRVRRSDLDRYIDSLDSSRRSFRDDITAKDSA